MVWVRNLLKSAIMEFNFPLKRNIWSRIVFSWAKISKMVLNGVLKPFGVESTLEILWENQNDLGQKSAEVCHYGLVFPTKTRNFE